MSKIEQLKSELKRFPIQSGGLAAPVLGGGGAIPSGIVEMILELDARLIALEENDRPIQREEPKL